LLDLPVDLIQKIGSRIPVVVGPTGVGKTQFSIGLAAELGAEIISVDSRQIYRGFRIGTAQPDKQESDAIHHHLIDILDPDKIVSAGDYAAMVLDKKGELDQQGVKSIISGGTLLYIQAICNGIIDEPDDQNEIRDEIALMIQQKGAAAMYTELESIDPEYAATFHSNDIKRLARAFEIFRLKGKPPSEVFKAQKARDKSNREKYFFKQIKKLFSQYIANNQPQNINCK